MTFSIRCTNFLASNGNSNDNEARRYCDFSQNSNGMCQLCSNACDGCTSKTTDVERECNEICEGNSDKVFIGC